MMRNLLIIGFAVVFCVCAQAQEVLLDGFEGGIEGWTTTGWPVLTQVADGAAGSTASLNIFDAGWGMEASKTFTGVVPEDGDYKVTFYYKNGVDGLAPQDQLRVRVNGGAVVNLPTATITEWTFAQTGFVYGLSAGADITIDIVGQRNATLDQQCRFDEFTLVREVPPIEGVVRPLNGYIVSGIPTITVIPAGGTGSFVSAAFDVGDNGSVDYTDSTPGDSFTFDWDTHLLTDAKISAVTLAITITDSGSNTGTIKVVYGIDNRYGGRDSLILNGDFEDWTGEIADEWVLLYGHADGTVDPEPAAVIIKETTAPFSGSNALGIYHEANPDPYRYIVRSNAFDGRRTDYILWYAGKGGGFCRFYYLYSEDGETWVSTWRGIFSNSTVANWNEVIDSPYTPATPYNYLAVATHFYGTGYLYWDAVSVTATGLMDPTSVGDFWDLYK